MSDVVVISVNYFSAIDTQTCIKSVRHTAPNAKMIVVDNSPNDPSLQSVKDEFGDEVHFIDAASNLGFGGGNNLGFAWALENSSCKYVLLLNNDARAESGSIEALVQCLEEAPELGAVSGLILVEDTERVWFGGGAIDLARGGGRLTKVIRQENDNFQKSDFLSGAVMLIRREVVERIGGFDDVFFMYEEDIDLSLRIQAAGWSLGVCRNAVFYHRVQGSQRTSVDVEHKSRWAHDNPKFDFLVYHNVRNNIINIRKHVRWRAMPRILLIYPGWLTLKTLAACRGQGISAIRTVLRGVHAGLSQDLRKHGARK